MKIFETTAQMRLAKPVLGEKVKTSDFYSGIDGGGAEYKAISVVATDDLVIHDSGDALIVWKLITNGLMDFRMFGGKADGVFNNTPAIEAANSVINAVSLLSSAGTFYFATAPTLGAEFTTYITGQGAITGITAIEAQTILVNAGNLRGYAVADELRYSGIEMIAGTLRQNATTRTQWDWIKDSAHEPIGVDDSVPAVASGSVLTIPFLKTYNRVISIVCGPDESLANAIGFTCGSSVGLSNFDIKASVTQVMSTQIWYDGVVWQYTFSPGQGGAGNFGIDISSVLFNSGHITINHDNLNGTGVSVIPWTQSGAVLPYPIHIRSLSPTTKTELTVGDWAGGVTTVADTKMSFIYTKTFSGGIFMDGTNGSEAYDLNLGNIWFYGVMEV